jgi:hypothetical protein
MTQLDYLFFASGSSPVPDILGFSDIDHPVGVTVHQLAENSINTLLSLAGSGLPIFVDSGAFSEVKIEGSVVRVVKPITDFEWRRRLGVYRQLAARLGDQLHVVAPDMVGFQEQTLNRLSYYLTELRQISELGALILVPLQKGELSQLEMYQVVLEMMDGINWIPALPCKKAATSEEEILHFCTQLRPERVHLLGLGPSSRAADAVLDTICAISKVQMDSCLLRSSAGWTNGRNKGPRPLTIAKAIATAAGYDSCESQRVAIALAFRDSRPRLWTYQSAVMRSPRGSIVDKSTRVIEDTTYLTTSLSQTHVADEFDLPCELNAQMYMGLWRLDGPELVGVAVLGGSEPLSFSLRHEVSDLAELWFLAQCFRQVEVKMPHMRKRLVTLPRRVVTA